MTEPDHRIHNPELAHYMGYAEKPFLDLADGALVLGMGEVHRLAVRRANVAGVVAGKEYLAKLQESITYFDTNPSSVDKHEEGERFKDIVVTEADFRGYAKQFALNRNSQGNSNKSLGIRSWNKLHHLAQYQDPESHAYRQLPIKTTPEFDHPAPLGTKLKFESLVALVDEYEVANALYGSIPSDILGPGFTDNVINFLTEFVDHKKIELEQTQQSNS